MATTEPIEVYGQFQLLFPARLRCYLTRSLAS